MITREQVADLREGDVVEIRGTNHPEVVVRGPLHEAPNKALDLGGLFRLRAADGRVCLADRYELTVVSRAPRLYVNHPRTEPVPGDVVRDADSDGDCRTWTRNVRGFSHEWLLNTVHGYVPREKLPARLRLLVDGDTGMPPAGEP